VLNTGKFNFEEAENNSKWLDPNREEVPESEEYGISSFLYNTKRPFNPNRLHKLFSDNFML